MNGRVFRCMYGWYRDSICTRMYETYRRTHLRRMAEIEPYGYGDPVIGPSVRSPRVTRRESPMSRGAVGQLPSREAGRAGEPETIMSSSSVRAE